MTTHETGRRVGATAAGCPEVCHRERNPMTTDPQTDFDGCNRKCRQAGAHTLVYGQCEHAPEPEPTVSLSRVYTAADGLRAIGFDTYTVPQLAELLEPALRAVAVRLGPNALGMLERGETVGLSGGEYADLAREAAHAIVHRDAVPAAGCVVSAAPTQADLRQRIAQALVRYDWNAGLSGRDTPSEHHYGEADAVLAVLPQPTDRAAVLREAADALPEADLPFVPPMDRRRVADWLRRVADEAQQQPDTETPTAAIARVRAVCDRLRRASVLADGQPHTDRERGVIQTVDRVMAAVSGPRAADNKQDGARPCKCPHPADSHSVYGCEDDCACEWMPKRKPMGPLAADDEQDGPLTPCTCRQTIHAQEHKGRTIPDCPWCTPNPDIRPKQSGAETGTTGGAL